MSTHSLKPTHVALLLDRSGSMAPLVADVIGGVNQFLTEQRAHELVTDCQGLGQLGHTWV